VPRAATIEQRTSILRDAVEVIRRDHAKDLTVDAVAREIATSRRQLQRCFNDHDTSFSRELTRARMDAALALMREPITVAEVARRVGYRQPAQFAKSFRAYHGVLPSALRQQRQSSSLRVSRGSTYGSS
jgi:AraC-like DNA-binding protein